MQSSEIRTAAVYDRDIFLRKCLKSSRFNKLNAEIILELFDQRPNFEYTKKAALTRLEKTINDQLNILTEDDCEYTNMEKLSKFIFTWSGKEFLKRRALKDCVWIDVLTLHTKGDYLERFKLQTDLKEIKAFLKSIFLGLQRPQDNFDIDTLVYKPLRQAENNLNILERLCNKKEQLKALLQDQKFSINAMVFAKRTTKEQRLLLGIEETVINAQTCEPIKARFEINWRQCKTEQAQFKADLVENSMQRRIDEHKFEMCSEEISGDTIRDTYYALAEDYKNAISALQNNFNFKLDEIENKINYTRLEISKLVENRNLLDKQTEKFREDIRNRLEMEVKERERKELERLKLEEEVARKRSSKRKTIKGTKRRVKPKRKTKKKM